MRAVEEHEGYVVVEKFGEAAEIVRKADPRSQEEEAQPERS